MSEAKQKDKLLSPKLMKVAKHGLQSGYILASDMSQLEDPEKAEVRDFFRDNHPTDIPPTFVQADGETVMFKPGIIKHNIESLAKALAGEFDATLTISSGAIVFEDVGKEPWGEAIAMAMVKAYVNRN